MHRFRRAARFGAEFFALISVAAVFAPLGQNAALACTAVSGSQAILVPAVSTCLDLHSSDFTLHMPPDGCLVQADDNPTRFHVVACRDVPPGSCTADLGRGTIIHYERRGDEEVPALTPCSGIH